MAGSYLKRISSYDMLSDRVRNVIQMVTLEGRVKSWLSQREVQTLAPSSPSHSWPIVAQCGSECWIAGFTKLKKLLDSHPQNSDVAKVWGEGCQVSDYLTSSSDEVYLCLNPDYKGSLTSAKSFSFLNLNLTSEAAAHFPFPSFCPGYQAAQRRDAACCGVLCEQWWWILYRAWAPLRGANEEDSQSHSLMFMEILHNPIWS